MARLFHSRISTLYSPSRAPIRPHPAREMPSSLLCSVFCVLCSRFFHSRISTLDSHKKEVQDSASIFESRLSILHWVLYHKRPNVSTEIPYWTAGRWDWKENRDFPSSLRGAQRRGNLIPSDQEATPAAPLLYSVFCVLCSLFDTNTPLDSR